RKCCCGYGYGRALRTRRRTKGCSVMGVRIDASADYLGRATGLPSKDAFTMAAWVFFHSYRPDSVVLTIFESGVGGYFIFTDSTTGDQPNVYDGTTPTALDIASLNTWYFMYLRSNGTNTSGGMRSVTASAFTTASGGTSAFTPNQMRFGNDDAGFYSNITIAGMKIWDAHLSDAELEQEYMNFLPHRFADLHLWAPAIDSVLADASDDWSGNARDLTQGGTLTLGESPPVSWGRV